MKKSIAMILTVLAMTASGTSLMAAEPAYIPWTFDDFDSNCEVIETTGEPVALSATTIDIISDEETGELGW